MAILKHRLFVLTDISSLQAGVREPDDGQSLIRLMFYLNQVDVEGLAATSNLGHGETCRPELIRRVLEAYALDLPRLRRQDAAFPDAARLQSLVYAGTPHAGPRVPVQISLGPGKETEASERLIQAVDREDPRPLWVTVWGGTADLAQALWTVRDTRTAEQRRRFVSRLRVHACYDQDSTAAWIKAEFPELFYVTRKHGVRGMYRGGDTTLCGPEWVARHIHGHGELGNLYPSYQGGDIWSGRLGAVRGIKEGDTPTYLNLLGADPLRGWGGTLVETAPNRWEDETAPDAAPTDPDPRMAGVYRHRPAFQADFARRLNWLS